MFSIGRTKTQTFQFVLMNEIVCIMTDGASVMTKVGKISPTDQQLCFAHGLQLAVLDVLYRKKICQGQRKC